jgi:hypothetical protein
MKTPTVTIESLKKAYSNGCDDTKKVLKDLYGNKVFESEKIETFGDACSALGIDENHRYTKDDKSIEAYRKLIIIARALNDGWTPDWNDSSEYKYYPWFKMKSGFGLSDAHYGYTCTLTYVGSRLCFKSEELARYAGEKFEKLYEEYLSNS